MFAIMGINPRFEGNAKALTVLLIANEPGDEGRTETMSQMHSLFAKIEAVCELAARELAARELEEKLQRLPQTLHLAWATG